jgi:hypothetical protein
LIPSNEVFEKAGAATPWQSGPIWLKVGIICGFTTIVIVEFVAHWPGFGVNVWTIFPEIEVDTIAGFQVPVIPSFDVSGNITWMIISFSQ